MAAETETPEDMILDILAWRKQKTRREQRTYGGCGALLARAAAAEAAAKAAEAAAKAAAVATATTAAADAKVVGVAEAE